MDELAEVKLPAALDDAEISVKKKTIPLMNLCVHKKDTLRIKDDITLASNRPNVENLLWYTIEPRNLDIRPEENKLRVKGELAVLFYTQVRRKKIRRSGWSILCHLIMRQNVPAVWRN